MHTAQTSGRLPKLQFRVLVIGRANAGKTSILQRVCETTESPAVYRGKEEVTLKPTMDRGEHCIDDELIFSNHKGYVFHDSQGIEAGDEEKLEILKDFIRRKCDEKRLRDKLHAIWYCVPMDGHRPELDLKYYKNICPDQNVPVIAVFTKYDQFRRNVEMDVFDYPHRYPDSDVPQVTEKEFQEYYLRPLGDDVRYVRLEKMHLKHSRCDGLVEKTATALNDDTVALMLLAVQRGHLELSVKTALSRVHHSAELSVKQVIEDCLVPFPYIWFWSPRTRPDEFKELEPGEFFETRRFGSLDHFTDKVMLLPAIESLANNGLSNHYLIIAIILILKHATTLCLSNKAEEALTLAELNYQEANIGPIIQEYLKAFTPGDTVEEFAGFIMATNIAKLQPNKQPRLLHGEHH